MYFRILRSLSYCIILFLFFLFSVFAVCSNDFSNVDFQVESGATSFQDEIGNYVIHNNLTAYPLKINLIKVEDEASCYTNLSYSMKISGLNYYASSFLSGDLGDGRFGYYWEFDLSPPIYSGSALASQIFNFVLTSDETQSRLLTIYSDQQNPQITLQSIKDIDGNFLDINAVLSNSLSLSSGDKLNFTYLIQDDYNISYVGLTGVSGFRILSENLISKDNGDYEYTFVINLTTSPAQFGIRAVDIFLKDSNTNVEFEFDYLDPRLDEARINSYQINGEYIQLVGDMIFIDEIEINMVDIRAYFTPISDESLIRNLYVNSCTQIDDGDLGDLVKTKCSYTSDFISAQTSFDSYFNIQFKDSVGNQITQKEQLTIQIDSKPPVISLFELQNSHGTKNLLSSQVNATLTLEYVESESEAYRNSNKQIQILPYFGEHQDDFLFEECVEISGSEVRCIWKITQDRLYDVEGDFNLTIEVIDRAGNVNSETIYIKVDNEIPEILNISIVERGNEVNDILQSQEKVRIELYIENSDNDEDLNVYTDGSSVIFRNSPDLVSFSCDYLSNQDIKRCYSNDFFLNNGFDGERVEDLRIFAIDESGNKGLDSIDVKIFKINNDEAIDYFDVKDGTAILLNKINREVLINRVVDIYHYFELVPKNDLEEYSIVNVQLLGMPEDLNNSRLDLRLQDIQLQNESSRGVVLGDNRKFYMKSTMPQLRSAYETEDDTYTEIMLSIVKVSEDTLYNIENVTIKLPIEFYDLPRDSNSNIAAAEKLLKEIEEIQDKNSGGLGQLRNYYMDYYELCSTAKTLSSSINSVSGLISTVTQAMSGTPAEPLVATSIDPTNLKSQQTTNNVLGNVNNYIDKVCILASCSYSQKFLGDQINSLTNTQAGDYLTGQKTFLGAQLCE